MGKTSTDNRKTLLKHAKIYDGSGSAAFLGDILLEGDRIVQVAPAIAADGCEEIDLTGLSIAPGFIDAHSHNDWFALRKDSAPYFAPFIRQGITTFVSGNCGLSATGFSDGTAHKDLLGGGLFFFRDGAEAKGQVKDFLEAADGNMPCNLAVLAGHCSARASASGSASRKLTAREEEEMLATLELALQQGAAGISLGLMYDPGLYADTEELKKVAALCEKYNKPLTVHPRANSAVSMAYPELLGRSHLLRAVEELAEIVQGTNAKLHYSHAIFVGRRSFKNHGEFLQIVENLRAQGVDMMFDIYNETRGVSVITVILPTWYQAMTLKERKKPLVRAKLRALVVASSLLLGFGFKDIEIAYIGEGFEHYEGKSVHQIAKEEGMGDLEAYLMLCEKSNFKGRVNMGPYTTAEIISNFEKNPNCLYMTDAWVEDHGVQNPAIYDCFPKFLRDSLRGTGDTMEQTIHRMTGATAERFQLRDRGYVRPGYFADLTVFSEKELKDATPDQKKSFGIRKVWINGKAVLDGETLDFTQLKTSGKSIFVQNP
ncbi:MAG: amidohydrolase family protein [Clostridia bacterium]|nr:amidohydrolase family protein [Clostridia bacterium]